MRIQPIAILAAPALLAVPALLATPAFAQPVPPPDDPCADIRGASAPPPPEDGEADAAIAEPGFGGVFVVSPPFGALTVPRNVEVRLAGDVNSLDVDPPQMAVQILDEIGARVPFERRGLALRPLAPLAPRASFVVRIEATDANPCPDCFGIQEVPFTTGADIDDEAPVLTGTPPVNVFVMPNGPEAEECGVFFGQTHNIVIDFGPTMPVNTWINITGKKEGDLPRTLFEQFNTGQPFPVNTNVGNNIPTALGDVFFVAITPRDLAGNVGNARVVRVRARSFIDQQLPRDELAPLWCDMPQTPVVRAAAELPTNGQVMVEFPFEEVPVGLRPVDGEAGDIVPLVPISETASGNVYRAAEPLPENTEFDVVGLECTRCVCEGCTRFEPQRVSIGASLDDTPPAAPVFVELREDVSPELSVEEQCVPDRPALVAVLEPGVDDLTAPEDLRYDASIAIREQPPVVLARGLLPVRRPDGKMGVRIETSGFGRVLGETFELTLEVSDSGGNKAIGSTTHTEDEESGCAASPLGGPLALAGFLGLAVRVRRRVKPV